MRVHAQPALVGGGLLLDWLDEVFATLPHIVDAGELGPGLPPRSMPPRVLRNWLLEAATGYQTRDRAWAAVVVAARRPDPAGAQYRLVALGLAITGLRGFRRRIHLRSPQDLPDVHADLACGFLTRLASIDTTGRNVAGRLIGSAIGHAARRYRQHLGRPRPGDLDTRPPPNHPGSVEVCLYRTAARLADAGRPLDPLDVSLIAATRLDTNSLITVAAQLGLPVEAAYKRRQRAEARITALLSAGRRAPGRPTPWQRGRLASHAEATAPTAAAGRATAAEASAAPPPRQRPATPARR